MLTCTASEESHYDEHLPVVFTTLFAQGLLYELPQVLTNEEISQTSNPYSDEEIQNESLSTTAFLGVTDIIKHSSQQVINVYQ